MVGDHLVVVPVGLLGGLHTEPEGLAGTALQEEDGKSVHYRPPMHQWSEGLQLVAWCRGWVWGKGRGLRVPKRGVMGAEQGWA